MQFCQEHWDMLRQEVIDQGMGNMISGNAEIGTMRLVAEITHPEKDLKEDFDPLMRCFTMIMVQTLDIAGPVVFTSDFGCPICEFNLKRNPDGSCPCGQVDCEAKEPGTIPPFESWLVGPDSCVTHIRVYAWCRGWL